MYAHLLTSKTRVSPLKDVSIPRLELMSARLLAQLMSSVKKALEHQAKLSCTKFWLDSMTALHWIGNRGEWKQFVQHRVNEILKLADKIDWGHCPGVDNPADIGSRGELATQLKDNQLWWVGPKWLSGPKEGWPRRESKHKNLEVVEEERKVTTMVAEVRRVAGISVLISLERYGKLLRFRDNVQARVKGFERRDGRFSIEGLVEAENMWMKEAQTLLKAQPNYSQLSVKLGLIEEEGILRCKGRLGNADMEFGTRYPIILPKEHKLTELIVLNCHSQVHHCGV